MNSQFDELKNKNHTEKKEEVDMTDGIKNIKGAFDTVKGGSKLKGLNTSINGPNSRTFDSLKMERDRLQKEFEDLPMPKGDKKLKHKRYYTNKKIKEVEQKMAEVQKAKINKDPIDLEDAEKFENLAQQINYKCTPLALMDRVHFEIEKKNILSKADKCFNDQSELIATHLIYMSHITDGYECIAGYSLDLAKGKDQLKNQIKKALIYEGMKGRQVADMFGNPYIGLGLALSLPMFARYQYNKAHPPQPIEGKKKIPENDGKIPITQDTPLKVEMGDKIIQ